MDNTEKKLLQKIYHREYYKRNKNQIIENSKEYRRQYYEKKKQLEIDYLKNKYPIYNYLTNNSDMETSKRVYKTRKNPMGTNPIFNIEYRRVIVYFD